MDVKGESLDWWNSGEAILVVEFDGFVMRQYIRSSVP